MCTFAHMKRTLHDYIKQNEDLRHFLLAQEGGIMKYLAEHPDADFDIDLFDDYEKQIEEGYIRANKQNRAVRSLPADELRNKSLDWYHRSKGSELKYYVAMKPTLNAIDETLAEEVLNHIEIYMADAYKESHRRKYPEGMPPQVFYKEVLEKYGHFGLALDCLEYVLEEYRGEAVKLTARHFFLANIIHQGESPEWKEVEKLQTEFDCQMFYETYLVERGYKKLRQAVKEMIGNSTRNIGKADSRELCRKLAIDNMRSVNQFTRWVSNKTYPMEESEEGVLVPLITPEERHWLQNIMYENSPAATGTKKLTTMGRNYSQFIHILQDIGKIWAAQLLVRGIDMKELEEETGIILSKLPNTMYYVDRMYDDRRGDCCVYDWANAKKLLNIIKNKKNDHVKVLTWEDEKQCFKDAVLSVMEMKKEDGNYLFEKNTQWMAVYRFAVDSGIMYDMDDSNEPQDKSTPQYAVFEKFTHELQLDVESEIRIPFKKDYIKDLKKSNYIRYNTHHPWSKDGITDPRYYIRRRMVLRS